jgi:predicted RNase H-like HicB family nuclease
MPKKIEEYMKAPYQRVLIPEGDGSFFAEILEFPGCFANGSTPNEAIRNLERAAVSWIQATLDQGQDIPEPFANQGYSGKLVLRLPRSIHRQAVRMAARDGTSVNQFLVSAVSARVGAEDLYNRVAQRLAERASGLSVRVVVAATNYGPGSTVVQLLEPKAVTTSGIADLHQLASYSGLETTKISNG